MRSFALSYSDHIAWNTKISHDIRIIVIVIIIIRIKIIRKNKFLMCYIWQVVADLKFHTECFSCGRCQHFLGEEDNYVLLERHRLVW